MSEQRVAGPELDKAVHAALYGGDGHDWVAESENIGGWAPVWGCSGCGIARMQISRPGTDAGYKPYSTDIAAAWAVVERMRADGWGLWMADWAKPGRRDDPISGAVVGFQRVVGGKIVQGRTSGEDRVNALAICRAALAALDAAGGRGAEAR